MALNEEQKKLKKKYSYIEISDEEFLVLYNAAFKEKDIQ